ncbi:hypothetical protein ABPG75_008010 [Micractinium tetrahymenae]
MAFTPYTWIFALAVIVGFAESYGIGANDLANAFGTSVSAKALKYWQAVVVASIFEFLGAILLGANNTDTMKAGVADPKAFAARPEVFMYGMLCVMIAAAFWDIFSCTLELQVSTTHTTAGALIGMALATYGSDAVIWSKHSSSFPYVKGVSALFIGWGTSPVLAMIAASVLFFLVRTFVMHSSNPFERALWVFPLAMWLTIFTVVFTIIQTGNKNKTWDPVSNGKTTWISVVVALGFSVLTAMVFIPFMRKRLATMETEREAEAVAAAEAANGSKAAKDTDSDDATAAQKAAIPRSNSLLGRTASAVGQRVDSIKQSKVGQAVGKNKIFKFITYGLTYDMHRVLSKDSDNYNERASRIWDNAERFDWRAEAVFKYIQVFTACVMSFAHGANDVANAMGPFSAVYYTWQHAAVPGSKVNVPTWVLAFGGVGIVTGLATYGWHIMGLYGAKSVMISNCRGFSIELATALVVIFAARFGIPVSTSHICVFAAVAVGLFEGRRGVNWLMVLQTFAAMFITLGTAMGAAAGLTAFGVYSPMKNLYDATGYPTGEWQLSPPPPPPSA